jgi:hypothetical protein
MQQQDTWSRMSVVVLLCAMTLTGVAGVGLGRSLLAGRRDPTESAGFVLRARYRLDRVRALLQSHSWHAGSNGTRSMTEEPDRRPARVSNIFFEVEIA